VRNGSPRFPPAGVVAEHPNTVAWVMGATRPAGFASIENLTAPNIHCKNAA